MQLWTWQNFLSFVSSVTYTDAKQSVIFAIINIIDGVEVRNINILSVVVGQEYVIQTAGQKIITKIMMPRPTRNRVHPLLIYARNTWVVPSDLTFSAVMQIHCLYNHVTLPSRTILKCPTWLHYSVDKVYILIWRKHGVLCYKTYTLYHIIGINPCFDNVESHRTSGCNRCVSDVHT